MCVLHPNLCKVISSQLLAGGTSFRHTPAWTAGQPTWVGTAHWRCFALPLDAPSLVMLAYGLGGVAKSGTRASLTYAATPHPLAAQ